jgi:hypothetical protein
MSAPRAHGNAENLKLNSLQFRKPSIRISTHVDRKNNMADEDVFGAPHSMTVLAITPHHNFFAYALAFAITLECER